MTDDYQGITLLLLNRSGDGGGQMQTINFAGYSGNTADGAQWLFAARPHSGWGADPAPCGSVVVRPGRLRCTARADLHAHREH